MVCLFCLRETNYGVSMFGESEMAENARNIISAHFWFDVSSCVLCSQYGVNYSIKKMTFYFR